MIINKDSLSKHFSKASLTYDEHASVQACMADELFSLISQMNFENVFEIGCGTGYLTNQIALTDMHSMLINDLSSKMIDVCKSKFSGDTRISYMVGDAENLNLNHDKQFSLIVSNACFQWLKDLKKALLTYKSYLQKDGVIAFTSFGDQNFKELKSITGLGLEYLSSKDLCAILDDIGEQYSFKESILQVHYKDAKDLLTSLKATGVSGLSNSIWTKKKLIEFINEYESKYSDPKGVYLTWHAYFVVMHCSNQS